MWTDPYGPPEAACRGCGAGLYQFRHGWANAAGIVVCVKAPRELIGQGRRPDYVQHEPMPAGLRGAPEPAEP